jgi:hypothetical protein
VVGCEGFVVNLIRGKLLSNALRVCLPEWHSAKGRVSETILSVRDTQHEVMLLNLSALENKERGGSDDA